MKLAVKSFLLGVAVLLGSGCGESGSAWKPDEAILKQFVERNPETENEQSRSRLIAFIDSAVTRNGTDLDPPYPKAQDRTREAFDAFRSYFSRNVSPSDGMNICFPASYEVPAKADPSYLFIYAQQCRLIELNGESVADLREDPRVARYLKPNGELVATGDLSQMHADLNATFYSRDPNDEQLFVYGSAFKLIERKFPGL
jgi:hypothetical protein